MTRTDIGMKVCRNCHRELPIEDFYVNALSKDGHRNVCKHCYIERKMQKRKDNPNYNTKHRTEMHERKPRVGNGKGARHEYHARRYAENKDAIKVRNIERQLGRSISEPSKPKPKPKPVKHERLCEKCPNWPCFDGIENLETDFARLGCHGFPKQGEAS